MMDSALRKIFLTVLRQDLDAVENEPERVLRVERYKAEGEWVAVGPDWWEYERNWFEKYGWAKL